MTKSILPSVKGSLVLALDQADTIGRRLPSVNDSDAFFGMLRAWASNAHQAPWDRLRVVLAVCTTPIYLTQQIHHSPFHNLSQPIRLSPLDANQVGDLALKHGLKWEPQEVASLMTMLGGHPYLHRRAMFEAVQSGASIHEMQDPSKPKGRLFDDFLETYRSRLKRSQSSREVLQKVSRGQHLAPHEREALQNLEKAGLVVQTEEDCWALTCTLYERLLGL